MEHTDTSLNINFDAPDFKVEDYCNTITAEYTTWLDNEAKSANTALYAILTRCYALSLAYGNNKAIADKVEKLLKARNVRGSKNPNSHARVLNLVFHGKGYTKRRSVYANAMNKAEQAGTTDFKDFTAWLISKGGLEELRGKPRPTKSAQKKTKEAYKAKARNKLFNRSSVSPTVIKDLPTDKAQDGLIVLICKMDGTSGVPVAVVDKDLPLNAVLKWASDLPEEPALKKAS